MVGMVGLSDRQTARSKAKRADEPTVEDQQPEDAVAAGDDVDEGGTVDHPERG